MALERLHEHIDPEKKGIDKIKHLFNKHVVAIKVASLAALFVILVGALAFVDAPKKVEGPPRVCFKNDVCLDLILAQSVEEKTIGLSNYSNILATQGMLFIFDNSAKRSMWMKNMSFNIDIMWIGSDKRIGYMEENLEPCWEEECDVFTPAVKAKYILETKAGFIDYTNLYLNDRVELQNVHEDLI